MDTTDVMARPVVDPLADRALPPHDRRTSCGVASQPAPQRLR